MATPKEVADWMWAELNRVDILYQHLVVWEIQEKFGDEFTHINRHGNAAIDSRVLAEFRKLTKDTVVWLRGQRAWKFREEGDAPGRLQNY